LTVHCHSLQQLTNTLFLVIKTSLICQDNTLNL
jgi:hypothetical protein